MTLSSCLQCPKGKFSLKLEQRRLKCAWTVQWDITNKLWVKYLVIYAHIMSRECDLEQRANLNV